MGPDSFAVQREQNKNDLTVARYTGPPMDLDNMRSLGVTNVDVYCACGHQASVDVSGLPGDLAVPEIKHRLRCSKCGKRPSETRPDWSQYEPKGRYMPEARE
jgi:hypothetical protein